MHRCQCSPARTSFGHEDALRELSVVSTKTLRRRGGVAPYCEGCALFLVSPSSRGQMSAEAARLWCICPACTFFTRFQHVLQASHRWRRTLAL